MRLAIYGGRVIDPASGFDGVATLLVEDGRIAALLPEGAPYEADERINATGLLVLPGLIDIHVHAFAGQTGLGLPADQIGVEQGITTIVDAGSAGVENLPLFLEQARAAKTRVLAFLNISRDGLARGRGELSEPTFLAPDETVAALKAHADVLVGVKARASASVVRTAGIAPIKVAKETAKRAGVPLMVHIGNAPPTLPEVLVLLEEGDIVTHAFHGKQGGIYEESGLIPEAKAALERGVSFDIGHGQSSFSFNTVRRYLAEGRIPDVISSDLWKGNETGPVFSQLVTMSKLLHASMPLMEVVAASTWRAAKAIRRESELGALAVGRIADISIVRLCEGSFPLVDSEGTEVVATQGFEPVFTLRGGEIVQKER
jgi:dihydroorotase